MSEQHAIAQEILAMAEDGALPPERSPKDQAIIKERLSKPRRYVSRDDFMTMLRQFNATL